MRENLLEQIQDHIQEFRLKVQIMSFEEESLKLRVAADYPDYILLKSWLREHAPAIKVIHES
jgi:hypothetical protein